MSGKGGVGKSLVTGMLASLVQRQGKQCAIIDGDILGPSIPKMYGIKEKAMGSDLGIFPAISHNGVRVMSMNLLLENEEDPVVWRGAILSNAVKQFYTDVVWDDVDYMFVDMPPGTGDVPLTVFQSIPVDGIIIVTSPQELVSMIVRKAYNMAKMMDINILGVVENYSYVVCPNCDEKIEIFGKSKVEEEVKELGIELLDKVPMDRILAKTCDDGLMDSVTDKYLANAVKKVLELEK